MVKAIKIVIIFKRIYEYLNQEKMLIKLNLVFFMYFVCSLIEESILKYLIPSHKSKNISRMLQTIRKK